MSNEPTFEEMAAFLIEQQEKEVWDHPGSYHAYGRLVKVEQVWGGEVEFSTWRREGSIRLKTRVPTPDMERSEGTKDGGWYAGRRRKRKRR